MSEKMKGFKAEVESKISKLLDEFAEGKLNREQFHAIYERYNGQLELVEKALSGGDVKLDAPDGGTIMLREQYMGKAQGLMIFANKTGDVVETLGQFGVSITEIIPVLDRFTQQLEAGIAVERVVRQVNEKEWLLFLAGSYTTVVITFQQEPSQYQTVVLQRMHTEFENANKTLFEASVFDPARLVFPFLSFVTRGMGNR
jgi:hypothetical protein